MSLKVPTGQRDTSWLFTKRNVGIELGATEGPLRIHTVFLRFMEIGQIFQNVLRKPKSGL